MSIAKQLENSVTKLRALMRRGNGDLEILGPSVLDDLDLAIDQVRALEGVTTINMDVLREFREKGGVQ